jgi:taurine dioxygenase
MKIKKITPVIGANVLDLDLSMPLDTDAVQSLIQAHAEHGVLRFQAQTIDTEQMVTFAQNFGELDLLQGVNNTAAPKVIFFDNDGDVSTSEARDKILARIWHTDEPFRKIPPMGTMLCARILPAQGGDTVFANMNAVYEGLSNRWQNFLSGLEIVQDIKQWRRIWTENPTVENLEKLKYMDSNFPTVTHPLVISHPVTGKPVIYACPAYTVRIKDMEENESNMILNMLYQKTLQPEYQYRHHWQAGDVLFWDNRLVQHCAVVDYYPQRRRLERVTIFNGQELKAYQIQRKEKNDN